MIDRRLESWVHSHLSPVGGIDSRGNIPCVCPKCGDNRGKFSVNIEKRMFNCWRGSCGFRGRNLLPLFRLVGSPESSEIYQLPESFEETPTPQSSITPEGYHILWETEFTPLTRLSPLIRYRVSDFFESRKIQIHPSLDIRYCDHRFEGDVEYGRLKNYLGFPYSYDRKPPEYYQYRILPGWGFGSSLKWRFPKVLENFEKSLHVYLTPPPYTSFAIVLESILDSIRVWQATGFTCISLGGSSLSSSQLKHLSRFSKLLVLMDGDSAGNDAVFGTVSRNGIAPMIRRYLPTIEVRVGSSHYYALEKDPDELENSEIFEIISASVPFNSLCYGSPKLDPLYGDEITFDSLSR